MRCATFYVCFWIAGLVGAEVDIGLRHRLVTREIVIRGTSDRKRGPQESRGSRPSSPLPEPPAQRHSPDRATPSRWTTSPSISSGDEEQAPSPRGSQRNGSQRNGQNASRSQSPQRNVASSSLGSPPGLSRSAGPSNAAPPGIQIHTAPSRIRTNPSRSQQTRSRETQRRATTQSQPNALARVASDPLTGLPRSALEEALRAHRQLILNDQTIAKASATVQNGRGSIMTSRLNQYGPSQLTADHKIGTFSRMSDSPYHASVLATNNMPTGSMSVRASGNLMVKGRIDSIDPNGRGVIRTAVPGRAEIKAELIGQGSIASEASNYNPSSGHARVQADFHGYGYVEAAATQDALRPEIAVGRARLAELSNPARSPVMQDHPSAAQEEAMPQVSGPSNPSASQPGPSRSSGSNREKRKSEGK